MTAPDDSTGAGSAHPWRELAAPFALGALDAHDASLFREHLADCELCRRELGEMREVAALIATSPRQIEPPAGLRERIMADARRVRPLGARGGAAGENAARATPSSASVPTAGTGAGAGAGGTPRSPDRVMYMRATPSGRGSRVLAFSGWIAAAASIAVAAYLGSMTLHQKEDLENFARVGTQLRQRVATRDSLLALRDSMIAQLLSPNVQTVTLASTGQLPSARLYVNRAARRVILSAYSLPSAPAGRTYQLWGLRDGGTPVSLGTFNTGPDARGVSVMDLPPGVTIVASAVTEEPAGGSAAPTSTPFLIARWKRG